MDQFFTDEFELRYDLATGTYQSGLVRLYRLLRYGDHETASAVSGILGRSVFLQSPFPAIFVCGDPFGIYSPGLQNLVRDGIIDCDTDATNWNYTTGTDRPALVFTMTPDVRHLVTQMLGRERPDDLANSLQEVITHLDLYYPEPNTPTPTTFEDNATFARDVLIGEQIMSVLNVFQRYFDTSIPREGASLEYRPRDRIRLIELGLRLCWRFVGQRRWDSARTWGQRLFRIITETPGCPVDRHRAHAPMRSCMIMYAYAMIKHNREDFGETQFPNRVEEEIQGGNLTAEEVNDCRIGLDWLAQVWRWRYIYDKVSRWKVVNGLTKGDRAMA
ncbi:hypothetical protein QBC43DRAFT_338264 [Cladorrhinum sp. PSN259]|nr:hypothetical protein QBC43DRAFT_338264 [Cladorrhinum sp. PSN259]